MLGADCLSAFARHPLHEFSRGFFVLRVHAADHSLGVGLTCLLAHDYRFVAVGVERVDVLLVDDERSHVPLEAALLGLLGHRSHVRRVVDEHRHLARIKIVHSRARAERERIGRNPESALALDVRVRFRAQL